VVIYSAKLLENAVRVRDPFVSYSEKWLVRRLAPDCSRIEIATLPKQRDEEKLLYSMGRETANIHLGTPRAIPAVKNDLAKRKGRWLHKASKAMLKATLEDWKVWRKSARN
jgi:hypothetical protein